MGNPHFLKLYMSILYKTASAAYKETVATDNSQSVDVQGTIIPRLHRSTIYMKLFNLITNNLGYRWEQSNIKDLDFETVLK